MDSTSYDSYENDLRKRQRDHLDSIKIGYSRVRTRCLHDSCPECVGTGRKKDGTMCIHHISCPCPRCSPSF